MTKNISRQLIAQCGFTLLATLAASGQTARITIDAAKVLNKIPANLYGTCIEDVNHEIYGGLYDQRLYGDSFEEPAPSRQFKGWRTIKGEWGTIPGGVSVNAGEGYKLIKETPVIQDGSIEADIAFPKGSGVAGFITHVNNAGPGADNFDGYEISLAPERQAIVLGKHRKNFQSLKEVKVKFDKTGWTHLRVDIRGAHLTIYVNNETKPVIDFTDTNNPLEAGSVGLRTFFADAQFRGIKIKSDAVDVPVEFISSKPLQVSSVWDAVSAPSAKVNFSLADDAFNGKQAQVIEYLGGTGKAGLANNGLNRWGIGVRRGQKFQGYIYLKADQFKGPVTVALQNAAGTKTYATQQLSGLSSNWKKHAFNLTANTTDGKARFAVYIQNKGKLMLDQAVLMSTGKDQFKGLPLRADIANKMVEQGLNFVRYGGTMVNVPDYKWKNMVGPTETRPPYKGHWYPYSSNKFGINEFVAFCEAAGVESAFAINVEETPQDVTDMVEYLTGDATTTWGKKRAAAGHPKPYPVKYIELGNEEVIWGDNPKDYVHYAERFNILYDAIHAKDPSIKVICAAWWRPKSSNMEVVFKAINGKADYWDLHTDADEANAGALVDKNLQNMRDLFLKWDPNTKMRIAIFEENGGLHDQQRALGHATTLNAVRRHGDFVLTSCAANGLQALGQNDNGWDQGQIFFTPSQVWGMPPFYSGQMAAKAHQPLLVSSTTKGDLDVTVTRDENSSELIMHIINIKEDEVKTNIDIKGFDRSNPAVKVATLAGDLKARNTPEQPTRTSTKETTVQLTGNNVKYSFPAHSYTILRFKK
ncbi:alpha-L-arabinofuranosidase C-terminal domain-containing protein [Mucilaginibacter myungsuensis]|uniref:non-reducing end alpha-L-arabinofuranosidase n=1 Tax=Mucilaginibacter myungsuensis TaxID=649104 RepID=A0A929KZN7_9SPHI|nr:alpha-L-arabinofuranosidase C-terminal domain-containing protein [Mucilaginibacter myungsuensis]MBE9663505.1 DUF1080 domain-containing protein [Mucilaginibacter myungsuensis]MDN3600243.1 alpha-L-arabinofuranosidase C-terminal domain-containing protein [Mucilaginibacter myungsuensis]